LGFLHLLVTGHIHPFWPLEVKPFFRVIYGEFLPASYLSVTLIAFVGYCTRDKGISTKNKNCEEFKT
jgi:hypothetical protein